MNRFAYRGDAVFGDDDHLAPVALGAVEQRGNGSVDVAQSVLHARMREVGPEALDVIIEVRNVDESQGRLARVGNMLGGADDPFGRTQARGGPPIVKERESAQARVQFVAE